MSYQSEKMKKLLGQFFYKEDVMKDMMAYCGLDCSKCDAYLATINNNQALREKTARLWSKLNNTPILPEHINCVGCRKDGIKTVFCQNICAIRQCAMKRRIETCGTCPEMEKCQTIQAFFFHNPKALKSLKK